MDVVDLDALERLLASATPGEWRAQAQNPLFGANVFADGVTLSIAHCWCDRHPASNNAALIAALHSAAPALIAAARRERAARVALAFYADPENYVLTGAPNATAELHTWAPHVLGDDGERARAAL